MNYQKWLKSVPKEITNDSILKMNVYRYALLIYDVAWRDAVKLSKNKMLVSLSDQLLRASGSISANIEEGYSKNSNQDRARLFEYALSSARGWYFRGTHKLSKKVYESRLSLLTEIIKLLLHIVPSERNNKAKESETNYSVVDSNQISKIIEAMDVLFD